MIRKRTLIVVLAMLAGATFAVEPKDDPSYYTAVPYKMTKAVKITITTASIPDEIDPKEDCTTFIVKPELATFFLNHALPVSEAARMHEHVISACGADGKVEFANGDKAEWTIKRGGIGFMQMLNGKFKDKVVILHCAKCEDWGL